MMIQKFPGLRLNSEIITSFRIFEIFFYHFIERQKLIFGKLLVLTPG